MAKKDKVKVANEQEKDILILKNANEMLLNSIKDCIERQKYDSLDLVYKAIKENNEQLLQLDKSLIDEIKVQDEFIQEMLKPIKEKKTIKESEVSTKVDNVNDTKYNFGGDIDIDKVMDNKVQSNMEDIDTDLQYDVLPLPSNGECYHNKVSKIPVAYLTAESENLITSPHLYRDDMIIDALLKYHVLSNQINIEDLVDGDVDAIMLWLRATGYGMEFPIIATDPITKKEFEGKVDLSKIKVKEFKLKGDDNGYFSYTLPISKINVKFKYLTYLEEKTLKKINQMDDEKSKSSMIKFYFNNLKECLQLDKDIEERKKEEVEKSLLNIQDWVDTKNSQVGINHLITNRLLMSIMEVNGNSDKEYIKNFVKKMPARDSLMLRRYMEDNKPGIDWNVDIEKPESLGGGSMTIFLEWGSDAFLNIE